MRLVLFLLKCLVGIFATVGLVVVSLVALGIIAWDQFRPKGDALPEAMVLELDLAAGVVETLPDSPLASATGRGGIVVQEAVEVIEAASADPKVKGLVLRVGRGPVGLAQAQELAASISRFRETGKPMLAFAESFGAGHNAMLHYALATTTNEVWLQPSGELGITGFIIESPYFRELLEDIGVTPRLGQREEYKGAANTFTDTALPEPQRRNLQNLLDSWMDDWLDHVARVRDLDTETVAQLVSAAPLRAAEAAEAGLVDELGYWSDARAEILSSAGDDVSVVSYGRYRAMRRDDTASDAPAVAVIHAIGPVTLAESENQPFFGQVVMGSDTIIQAIEDASEDPEVRAIVMRVDSPGGSYVASDAIWHAMTKAREKGTPVIVSMSNVAASGGYFIAAGATKVVAQAGTITGSIGVVSGKFVMDGLWDELGINFDKVQAGPRADMFSANFDFSEDEWENLQDSLDAIYADFTGKVAEARGLSGTQIADVAKGRVWTGLDAQEVGLVDRLGGYREAFEIAREEAGIEPGTRLRFKRFPEPRDPFQALLEDALGGDITAPTAKAVAKVLEAMGPVVRLADEITADPESRVLRDPRLPERY